MTIWSINLKNISKATAIKNTREVLLADPRFKDKYSEKAINQLVANTVAKYKEISDEQGNVSLDFLKRTIDKYKIDEDDARVIVSKASLYQKTYVKTFYLY